MNLLTDLLDWLSTKDNKYRTLTPHSVVVEDFLTQRGETKIYFPINSISNLKENVVAILILMGDPNLKTKKDLEEIDSIAFEMFDFLSNKCVLNE